MCAHDKNEKDHQRFMFLFRRKAVYRRRGSYNKFCNMPPTCGVMWGEYNGERWACSGLDVVTEIYDCGEIGKKKKTEERKSGEKNIMWKSFCCHRRSVYTCTADMTIM